MTAALMLALYLGLVVAGTTGVTGHAPALLLRSGEAYPECDRPMVPGHQCAPRTAPSWARR